MRKGVSMGGSPAMQHGATHGSKAMSASVYRLPMSQSRRSLASTSFSTLYSRLVCTHRSAHKWTYAGGKGGVSTLCTDVLEV